MKTTHSNTLTRLFITLLCTFIIGCAAVKPAVTNQYTLNAYSNQAFKRHTPAISVLVTKPEGVAGYETEQMLYRNKPYELGVFAHNAWANPPADMLFPLIIQSLQSSNYFFAVASNLTSEMADYRLDTQLLEFQQNFLHKPSTLALTAKVTLTQVSMNRLIASRIIKIRVPCTRNTPYGGVIAANAATQRFTAEVTRFVITYTQSK